MEIVEGRECQVDLLPSRPREAASALKSRADRLPRLCIARFHRWETYRPNRRCNGGRKSLSIGTRRDTNSSRGLPSEEFIDPDNIKGDADCEKEIARRKTIGTLHPPNDWKNSSFSQQKRLQKSGTEQLQRLKYQ